MSAQLMLAALIAVREETTAGVRPYSADSYLPEHILRQVEAAIEGAKELEMTELQLRYIALLNGELIESLGTCASIASMPASNQDAHTISEHEFQSRLLVIGKEARAAIARCDLTTPPKPDQSAAAQESSDVPTSLIRSGVR